jgi:hypothetical protein
MFAPSQHTVRRFFCQTFSRQQLGQALTPMEALAGHWIEQHPEYHPDLRDEQAALAADYPPHGGRENPFLHLSLHLSLSEQISIDQPHGIRAVFQALHQLRGNEHEAAHEIMDCLALMIWESQRQGKPPDALAYLKQARLRAGLPD